MKLFFCSDISWKCRIGTVRTINEVYSEELGRYKWLKVEHLLRPESISDKRLKERVYKLIENKVHERVKENIKEFIKIIRDEKPDCVFLLGDVISDGACKFSHEEELYKMLEWLSLKKIDTFLIEGNHDSYLKDKYEWLKSEIKNIDYVHEISGKCVSFSGLSILGIPSEVTDSLPKVKEFIEKNRQREFDLVVAHSHYRRRIWLTNYRRNTL